MGKHKEAAFLIYFFLLSLLVVSSDRFDMGIINLVYLVVILSCSLKFLLIVNENKK